jgi:predicted phage baseplate assembly protein
MFTLKQFPVTYVQAATPTGRQSTLQVQVNGVAWAEVPTLYQQPPSAQVFATLNQSDGTTEVIFGDEVEGATLPTGQNNVQADYRIGSGSTGNVAAGTLTTLIDRPLGVSGVTNPQAATGGQDAQSVDDIRSNAPQTVLTLGRAVSIADYQSYAATFAGISKAYAIWIPSGPGRGVFLTVAGVNGEALPPSNPTLGYLVNSLQSYGSPLIPVTVVSFLETLFSLSADVRYDPRHDQPTVQAQILATLSETYSFANRTFGRGVSSDEIAAVIQGVPGVIAVNVTSLTPGVTSAAGDLASQGGAFSISKLNNWLAQQFSTPLPRPASDPSRICPYLPIPSLTALPQPAEILVLDPSPLAMILGVMS